MRAAVRSVRVVKIVWSNTPTEDDEDEEDYSHTDIHHKKTDKIEQSSNQKIHERKQSSTLKRLGKKVKENRTCWLLDLRAVIIVVVVEAAVDDDDAEDAKASSVGWRRHVKMRGR